jgi:hypothetical protein
MKTEQMDMAEMLKRMFTEEEIKDMERKFEELKQNAISGSTTIYE